MLGEVGIDFTGGLATVGWWVAAEHRGRGVATRAVRLLATWPERRWPLVAEIPHDNPASVQVAVSSGFIAQGGGRWLLPSSEP